MADWLAALDRRARLRAKAGLTRTAAPRAGRRPGGRPGRQRLPRAGPHPEVTAAAGAGPVARTGWEPPAPGWCAAPPTRTPRWRTRWPTGWAPTGRWSSPPATWPTSARVRALVQPRTLLVSDAHNHASLIDGCRISGAETVVTPHTDVDAVAAALAAAPGRPAVVVTESIFSVDGDLAPLAELHAVARDHGALLLVDDAHALGRDRPRRRRRGGGRRAGRRAGRGGHGHPVQGARRRGRRGRRPGRVRPAPGRDRPHVHLRHRAATGGGRRGARRAAPGPGRRRPAGRAGRPGRAGGRRLRRGRAGRLRARRGGDLGDRARSGGARWPGRPTAGTGASRSAASARRPPRTTAPGCG